jgi:hypothetical protein
MPPKTHVTVTVGGHSMSVSNGGRDHRGDASVDWQERCMRLAEENHQLKLERNQQEQQLTELNSQFARLKRDFKMGTPRASEGGGGEGDENAPTATQYKAALSKLQAVTRQRDEALQQVSDLKAKLARFKNYDKAGIAPPPVSPSQSMGASATAGKSRPSTASPRGGAVSVMDILTGGAGFGGARSTSLDPLPFHYQSQQASFLIPSGARPGESVALDAHRAAVQELEQRVQRDAGRIRDLMNERDSLRAQQDVAAHARSSFAPDRSRAEADRTAAAEAELISLRQRCATMQSRLETVTLERDRLQSELSRASPNHGQSSSPLASAHQPQFEFVSTAERSVAFDQPLGSGMAAGIHYRSQRTLEGLGGSDGANGVRAAVAEQTAQLTVLARRFEDAQSHAVSLQRECERLVGELKAIHNSLADEKRRVFQLEHEKATLTVKAARTDDVERALTMKNEELIRCEQELLRMVDKLQECARETESQVRLEYNTRVLDLEGMRDEADRTRRAKERELFNVQLELQETKRQLEATREDLAHFRARYESTSNERADLASKLASHIAAHPMTATAAEETVSRLMKPSLSERQAELNVLSEGAQWDENWELTKAREALSAALLDNELAEGRLVVVERDLKSKGEALVLCTKQRDELLEENLSLRERLSHFNVTQVRRERAAIESQAGQPGAVAITVDYIKCTEDALRLDGESGDIAPALFVSLDGLSGFQSAVSEMVYTMDGEVQLPFEFKGLSAGSDALAAMRSDQVELQLHRSVGLAAHIVASGSIAFTRLLGRCAEDGGDATIEVPLQRGDGGTAASLTLRVKVSNIGLAYTVAGKSVAKDRAEVSTAYALATLGRGDVADKINSWLLAFRAVRALRVTVTRATNLAVNARGVAPTPYVFYTATGAEDDFTAITDTVVHTTGALMTQNPSFDAVPRDHAVTIGSALFDFLQAGAITFVIFDSQADDGDVDSNLGTAVVQLATLVESPQATIVRALPLHPSGHLEVALSWLR